MTSLFDSGNGQYALGFTVQSLGQVPLLSASAHAIHSTGFSAPACTVQFTVGHPVRRRDHSNCPPTFTAGVGTIALVSLFDAFSNPVSSPHFVEASVPPVTGLRAGFSVPVVTVTRVGTAYQVVVQPFQAEPHSLVVRVNGQLLAQGAVTITVIPAAASPPNTFISGAGLVNPTVAVILLPDGPAQALPHQPECP